MQAVHIKGIVIEPQDSLTGLKKEGKMTIQNIVVVCLLLTIIFMPVKGLAMEKNSKFALKIKENYQQLDFSDGISKNEAIIIAQYDLIKDEGKDWDLNIKKPRVKESGLKDVIGDCWAVIFDANLKMKFKSGLKWYTIHVDKKTGEIRSRGWGPS